MLNWNVNCTPGETMTSSRPELWRRGMLWVTVAFLVGSNPGLANNTDKGWKAYARGDYATARANYERNAQAGDTLAQFNLAMMLIRGEGGGEDLSAGVAWLRKAGDAGMAQAQYKLGLLYEDGIGIPRSLEAATAWWTKAAAQGQVDAQVQLATQYLLGRGAPKDIVQAAKWYEAAALNGDAGAQYIIASFYEHGDGVTRDLKRAHYWYLLAAQQGDVGAALQAKDIERRLQALPISTTP